MSARAHQFSCHCQQAWTGPTCSEGERLLSSSRGFKNRFEQTVCNASLPALHPDFDECQSNPCPAGSRCVNTRGSFSCRCPLGFDLDNGRTCTRGKLKKITVDRNTVVKNSLMIHHCCFFFPNLQQRLFWGLSASTGSRTTPSCTRAPPCMRSRERSSSW